MLDNLKDYAVRALVNAIDHLGTVAYKLGDILEQQTSDISSMELKVTCLNQVGQILIFIDHEHVIETQKCVFSAATAYMPNIYGKRRS